MNINDYIIKHAEETPEQLAIVTPTEQINYRDLADRISAKAAALAADGLRPQQAYVYRASQDIEFIVTYFAVHRNNAVAVPVEAGLPDVTFEAIKAETGAYNFPEGSAEVLFTSGSTGKSKGVILSDEALSACAENFIHDHNYSPDLVFIVNGPLSHIASLSKIHPTLMAGGTVCVINGMKDINAFYDVFQKMPGRRFATFLVPASIRMLLQFSRDQLIEVADKVAFIETGAAPITEGDMRELSAILPNAPLYNTLGGTEIGCACTYNFNDGKHMAGCVGRPMYNVTVTIDDEGTISCTGPAMMTGYINEPERTASVLTISEDGRRTFRTSDRGYFDEDGMLHLLGRSDDAINVGGFKADPIEIENMVMSIPSIADCIVIPVPNPITGNSLKLLYVVKPDHQLTSRDIALYLKARFEAFKVPALYEQVDHINLNTNGKKDRKGYIK